MRSLIVAETVLARPVLCPELQLHLVTEECRLWRAREAELAALGLPEPYWAFAWPGGQALARHILDHPELVSGKVILDFGTGSGIVALAAARAGAKRVVASDIDPFSVEATRLNAALNHLEVEATDADLVGRDDGWGVILAADMCYEAELSARVIPWFVALARRGARVLAGDPGRGHTRGAEFREIAAYDAPADVDTDGRIRRRTSVLEIVPQEPEAL